MGEAELYAGRWREADDVTNLNQINSQRQLLRVFGGLNEGYACSEAELSEEKNFSSRGYPALETRKPRRKVRQATGMNGMYHLNGLLTVEGTTLRYAPDDGSAAVELENALTDSEKKMVGMGTKVLIWPDKMSFDTAAGTLSALGSSWQQGGRSLTVTPCDAAGVVYTPNKFGATEPESPENGDVWLKQAEDAPWSYRDALKLYSTAGGWQNILLNYCRVTCEGLGKAFKAGDTVTLTGIPGVVKFLSTPSARRATSEIYGEERAYQFLSTPSARRATADVPWCIPSTSHFYPRPPRGGRRADSGSGKIGKRISIHALREEGDRPYRHHLQQCCKISIHALREEGDQSTPRRGAGSQNFYPRPPRGGRLRHYFFSRKAADISIHALREEGD